MKRPLRVIFWLWAGLLMCGGAACPQLVQQYTSPLPLLSETPTLEEITHRVNENTAKVESLSSVDLTLQMPLTPTLRGNLAYDRPRRLRLIAETGLTGPELDLGSNDDIFWMWVRRNEPPALFFCRHEEFSRAPLRRMIPFEPLQVVELLGLTRFDEDALHEGPFTERGGRLSIRSVLPTPQGELTRVVMVDAKHGWIVEQHLYDANRQKIASALLSKYKVDPLTEVALPEKIELSYVPQNLNLTLAVKEWYVNVPETAGGQERWQMPSDANLQRVDLARPSGGLRGVIPPPVYPAQNSALAPQ